jgi:hypothetical protein
LGERNVLVQQNERRWRPGGTGNKTKTENSSKEVLNMKIKRCTYFFGLLIGVILSIASVGWAQSKPDARGPIITHAFAVDKGSYGYRG